MILGYSVYEVLCLFLVYAYLGWCLEVAYAALETGKFVNRGFLNGPVCPIYGVGAVTVILCLTPISDNVWVLFAGGALLTSVLEFITGFALDKLFHTRWWDYTDVPFNLHGYICLKFSVVWGLVCIALMRGIHPVIYGIVHGIFKNNSLIAIIILLLVTAVFVTDVVITVVSVNKLSKRVSRMDSIAKKIREVSDNLGEHIYEGVSSAVEKGEEIYNSEQTRERIEKHKKELEELREKYIAAVKENHWTERRIIKAFPNIRSHKHREQLDKLKEKLKK